MLTLRKSMPRMRFIYMQSVNCVSSDQLENHWLDRKRYSCICTALNSIWADLA
jgi:hypothetical protein